MSDQQDLNPQAPELPAQEIPAPEIPAPELVAREPVAPGDGSSSVWRYIGVSAFLLMALFWVWVFWRGTIGIPHPDELDVPKSEAAVDVEAATPDQQAALRFIQSADAVCAATQAEINQLPFAAGVEDFAERADILDAATALLDTMVQELDGVAKPSAVEEQVNAGKWIDDYNQFLDDRRTYASVLRSGDDPPFEISARDGRRVTDYIVNFAEVNNMYSCVPPGDL